MTSRLQRDRCYNSGVSQHARQQQQLSEGDKYFGSLSKWKPMLQLNCLLGPVTPTAFIFIDSHGEMEVAGQQEITTAELRPGPESSGHQESSLNCMGHLPAQHRGTHPSKSKHWVLQDSGTHTFCTECLYHVYTSTISTNNSTSSEIKPKFS